MATQTIGTQELKDLATAVALSLNAVDAVLADGKVNAADMTKIPQLFTAFKSFTDVTFGDVLPEVQDLDPTEAKSLAAHFAAVFNISNDNVEQTVEKGLALVMSAYWVVFDIIDMVKQWKAPA